MIRQRQLRIFAGTLVAAFTVAMVALAATHPARAATVAHGQPPAAGGLYVGKVLPRDTLRGICDGQDPLLCLTDPGYGNNIYVGYTAQIWGFEDVGTYDGFQAYLIKINDGSDCATENTSSQALDDEGCNSSATNELWIHDGNWLVNEYLSVHSCAALGGDMVTLNGIGGSPGNDVWVWCRPVQSNYDQWGLYS
jgi:hypothetical protein